jgi:hypothetical protein
MLQSYLVDDNGICLVKENPNLPTNIRIGAVDLDVEGSYPSGGIVLNVSKETTKKEIIEIEGVDENTRRMCTINLSAGHVNAVEICTKMLGMPTLDQMLEAFQNDQIKQIA